MLSIGIASIVALTGAPTEPAHALLGGLVNGVGDVLDGVTGGGPLDGVVDNVTNTVGSTTGIVDSLLPGPNAPTYNAPPAFVKTGVPGAGAQIANGTVMLVWSGDDVALPFPVQAGRDKDFLAVVDAEPYSSTYGKVITTAELPSIIGGVPGGPNDTSAHNDPHHMTAYTAYTDPDTRQKFTFAGGVISKNVFRFNVTSVRSIGQADAVVCGETATQSSLTDDFIVMPNGNMMFTYMGSFGYSGNELGAGTPLGGGTTSEFKPMRTAKTLLDVDLLGIEVNVCQPGLLGGASEDISADEDTYLGEYQWAPTQGPSANVSRRAPNHEDPSRSGSNKGLFFAENFNASKEALPHGMFPSYDARYLLVADYAVPVSIGAAVGNTLNNLPGITTPLSSIATFSTFGAAVRVARINPLTLDPVPDYGNVGTNGYYDPDTITYGGAESDMYALDGSPSSDPADYMHSISVVPDGPRHEQVAFHEEPEGLMPFAMPHQPYHCKDQAGWNAGADKKFGTADDPLGDTACANSTKVLHHGSSVNSMCGGTMYYTANVRLPQSANGGSGPLWHAVYDVGPCSGVSYHAVMEDDRFVVQPIAGIESPNAQDVLTPPVFDRDHPRQHSRRMITFDFRPLISKGNGITQDCDGDGYKTEDDLDCGAQYVDPIQCGFPQALARPSGSNTSLGRPLSLPGVGVAMSPAAYVNKTGTPGKGGFNKLVHNNRAIDCPRVLGAVGQFETGSNPFEPLGPGIPAGLPTTQTGNNITYPGVGYTQFATTIPRIHSDTDVGGAPTLTNINTAQNINTTGGPHFTLGDRVGFCVPTGASNGLASCKAGSYYDLRPDANTGAPITIYPDTQADLLNCVAGTSAYKGGSPNGVDPMCVARVMFMQYFVELNHVPAPGTGSDGDRTICMMLVNRVTGESRMDPLWVDELTKQPCLDFDGAHRQRTTFGLLGDDICPAGGNQTAGNYCWPGARGGKGGGKPHAGSFERDGANLSSPGYYPPTSLNPDGNI
jgi:hypothetical protein